MSKSIVLSPTLIFIFFYAKSRPCVTQERLLKIAI